MLFALTWASIIGDVTRDHMRDDSFLAGFCSISCITCRWNSSDDNMIIDNIRHGYFIPGVCSTI
jgi:hypothetical protein